ncbi:MAG TPA: 4-hydroxythreonine-4-phosphate dehydrogenase PdxA [Clostridiales bacterium]|nr:4-hydroxythreonine-4-phosphate dehydrogenase PdxA [Clostridiales bacterium]
MGDPAGIGPEITIRALSDPAIYSACRPIVIGDADVLEQVMPIVSDGSLVIHKAADVSDALFQYGVIDIIDIGAVDCSTLQPGRVSAQAGEAAYLYIEKAIQLAQSGIVDATVTNPINKEALNLAGRHYAGHTEIYADLTNTKNVTMLLAHGPLRVVHVSTHVSLRRACDLVKKERILDVIRIADDACRRLGIDSPRIAVAGLNPHSGENGLFGTEEAEEIIPAIEAAREEGISAEGPVPPDTVFSKAQGGMYDIVVAMYHDQGHIPLKLAGFKLDEKTGRWTNISGVNITLGLPIIRTSVDHGTAFDQAWKGTASPMSLIEAINYAIRLANVKNGGRRQ